MLHTTLKLCKENEACKDGYKTLKKSLPKGHKKTDLISLTYIIESNDIEDAIWALRATVEDSDYLAREFAIWCAQSVLHHWESQYPDDDRVRNCIDVAEKFNNGESTREELATAGSAAWAAARAAGVAAWAASRSTARSAADAADAARYAARSTAGSAAGSGWAAGAAGWAAADAADAARYAARSTADAAGSGWAAADAAGWAAARSAGVAAQKDKLKELLNNHEVMEAGK